MTTDKIDGDNIPRRKMSSSVIPFNNLLHLKTYPLSFNRSVECVGKTKLLSIFYVEI